MKLKLVLSKSKGRAVHPGSAAFFYAWRLGKVEPGL